MKKKQIAITLGIMCFALTLAISIQLRTVKSSNTTISQSLKEDGLILESDAVINMLSLEVEKITAQFDEPKEKIENLNFDKSTLPGRGQLLAENDMG